MEINAAPEQLAAKEKERDKTIYRLRRGEEFTIVLKNNSNVKCDVVLNKMECKLLHRIGKYRVEAKQMLQVTKSIYLHKTVPQIIPEVHFTMPETYSPISLHATFFPEQKNLPSGSSSSSSTSSLEGSPAYVCEPRSLEWCRTSPIRIVDMELVTSCNALLLPSN